MSEPLSWVIGRGGLLGRNVEKSLDARGTTWHPPEPFVWNEPATLKKQLTAACEDFAGRVSDAPWQVAWCAGAAVVGSGPGELQKETEAFDYLLRALATALKPRDLASGALFVASSAGGMYAGATGAPFTERSRPQPLAPYGWQKLEQESRVRRWSAQHDVPVLIGRIANLYGPGQDLAKPQGLITQVCRRVLTRQPFLLYVPLDTIRDYLFAPDSGSLVADGLLRLREERHRTARAQLVVKILASQRPITVGSILAEIRRVTKRPARVVVARSPNARHQAADLRMASVVWPELDRRPLTTLGAGVQAVVHELLGKVRQGPLVPPS